MDYIKQHNANISSKRIVFFVPEFLALSSGVLHSQVLSMAGFLKAKGLKSLFIGCERTAVDAKKAEDIIKKKYGIDAIVFDVYSDKYGYISHIFTGSKLHSRSRQKMSSFLPTHIYCRNINSASIARNIAFKCNAKMVFDVRGALAEEIALKNGKRNIKYYLMLYKEKKELKKAECLSCVSKKLNEYIFSISGKKCNTVIPCSFNEHNFYFDKESRLRIRSSLGVEDNNKLICYSGGLSKWQRVDDIIQLFTEIRKINSDYRFLFLTGSPDALKRLISQSSLSKESYSIISCAHEEVKKYLSASDAGIIMRHDVLVNNVACPIKIGEYLGCGLPVIMTKGIGDLSEIVENHKIGVVLNERKPLAQQVISFIENIDRNTMQQKTSGFAITNLSFSAHLNEFKTLFS